MQTTEEGTTQKLSAADAAKAAAQAEPGQEPLESNQWDLRAIKADQAHKINDGSPDVTVGVIDTGVDDTHPDLAANFSKGQSANCVGASPTPPTAPGARTPTAVTTARTWRAPSPPRATASASAVSRPV